MEVALTLRVGPEAREHVVEAFLMVDDEERVSVVPMEPGEEGYRASVDTSGDPRVLFYQFAVNTDAGAIVYGARSDETSTAGCAGVCRGTFAF